MGENDRPAFTLSIEAMAATFRQEVTPALLLGYWLGLGDLDLAAVQRAIGAGIRECEFMPTVAKLRELAKPKRALYPALEPLPPSTPWTEAQKREADQLRKRVGHALAGKRPMPTEEQARASIAALARRLETCHGLQGGLGTEEI